MESENEIMAVGSPGEGETSGSRREVGGRNFYDIHASFVTSFFSLCTIPAWRFVCQGALGMDVTICTSSKRWRCDGWDDVK